MIHGPYNIKLQSTKFAGVYTTALYLFDKNNYWFVELIPLGSPNNGN